jgi:hypothetical protein
MVGLRLAAGVRFLDDDERVPMVVLSYENVFEIPGGGVAPGEGPLRGGSAAQKGVRVSVRPDGAGSWISGARSATSSNAKP